jgi:hypothetical protein
MAIPIAITRQAALYANSAFAATQPERFDALERAGFRVERFGDLWKVLSERLGGHYMDVGCSAKIAAGLVRRNPDRTPIGRAKLIICITTDQSQRRRSYSRIHADWSTVQ